MIFTRGFELTTSITNIFIFIFSLYGYLKIKNKRWNFFFLCMTIDSLLGSIVHGIVMSQAINNLLWVFLVIFFIITLSTLLCIYINLKMKHIIILSLIMTFILFVEIFYNLNFIFTFTMYVLISILLILYIIIKDGIKKHKWFFIGIIILLIGGFLMLGKVKWWILNHNGICHIFILITLICFYIGIKDMKSNE